MAPPAASGYFAPEIEGEGGRISNFTLDLFYFVAGFDPGEHVFPYDRILSQFFLYSGSKILLQPYEIENVTEIQQTDRFVLRHYFPVFAVPH